MMLNHPLFLFLQGWSRRTNLCRMSRLEDHPPGRPALHPSRRTSKQLFLSGHGRLQTREGKIFKWGRGQKHIICLKTPKKIQFFSKKSKTYYLWTTRGQEPPPDAHVFVRLHCRGSQLLLAHITIVKHYLETPLMLIINRFHSEYDKATLGPINGILCRCTPT